VTIVIFAAVAGGGALLSLLLRDRPAWPRVVLPATLAACLALALMLPPSSSVAVGDATIGGDGYVRLWLVAATEALLLLALLADGRRWPLGVGVSLLAGLALMALALGVRDPVAALLLASAAGGVAILGARDGRHAPDQGLRVSADLLRSVAAAAAIAVVSTALLAGDAILLTPGLMAAATLAMALAVALRVGAVPLHRAFALAGASSPPLAVPLIVAWLPATFVLAAFAWQDGAATALELDLDAVRPFIVAVALLTLGLGALAMVVQRDVAHLVGYSVVADGGLVLLALAAGGPDAGAALRTWLLLFALSRTAAVGFALALGETFGTRRFDELDGWLRRAPILAVALLGLLLATYGWPGSLPWVARAGLVGVALPGPLGILAAALAWATLLGWLRLGWRGVQSGSRTMGAGTGERLAFPVRRRSTETAEPDGSALARVAGARTDLAVLVRVNRPALASILVLALAILPLVLAAGGGQLDELASAPIPTGEGDAAGR
jgi:hypothetical protein